MDKHPESEEEREEREAVRENAPHSFEAIEEDQGLDDEQAERIAERPLEAEWYGSAQSQDLDDEEAERVVEKSFEVARHGGATERELEEETVERVSGEPLDEPAWYCGDPVHRST